MLACEEEVVITVIIKIIENFKEIHVKIINKIIRIFMMATLKMLHKSSVQ